MKFDPTFLAFALSLGAAHSLYGCSGSKPEEKAPLYGNEIADDHSIHKVTIPDSSQISPPLVHDVDGDGFDDLVVGAFVDEQAGTHLSGAASGYNYGMVYLFLGPIQADHNLVPDEADMVWTGDQIESTQVHYFGINISAIDNIVANGSGLAIGSGQFASEDGRVPAVWLLNTADLFDGGSLEDSIAGAISLTDFGRVGGDDFDGDIRSLDGGDFNGDGIGDVALRSTFLQDRPNAAAQSRGVCIFYGPAVGYREIVDADFVLWDDTSDERWADAARLGGDINGDGYNDILAAGSYEGGEAFVALGGPDKEADQFDPEILIAGGIVGDPDSSYWQFDGFGRAPEYIGDRNGDGADDIAVGAPSAGTYQGYEGASYIFEGLGAPGTYSPGDATLTVQGFVDAAVGSSVVGMGNLFGDGSVALLVGSFGLDGDDPFERVGSWLYGSATGEVDVKDARATFSPGDDDESEVRQMASGDMDGDGLREAVVLNYDDTLFIIPGALFVP